MKFKTSKRKLKPKIDDNFVYYKTLEKIVDEKKFIHGITKCAYCGKIVLCCWVVIRSFLDKNELKETYHPVSKFLGIRLALAIINKLDLNARQMNEKTGTLEKAIFMEILEGYDCSDDIRETMVFIRIED